MKRFLVFLLIPLVLANSSGCMTIYNPATGREEFYLISTQEEIRLGRQVARQMEQRYQVVKDSRPNRRLHSIAWRIVNVCDRKDVPYRFRILNIPGQINAFAAPGGIIYVTDDLMNLANDDEFAAVLAHEAGHVAARHSVKKLQMSMGIAIIESLIFQEKKMDKDLKRVRQITNTMVNLVTAGYSREDEFLADRLGVKYAYQAGFDPWGMVTFLTKLQKKSKNRDPSVAIFFHSHPPYRQRIEAVKNEIIRLKAGKGR